jgi:predicted cation transporter
LILCLCIILILIFILPLTVKKVEQNLEIFLFIMGLAAAAVSHILTPQYIAEIFKNRFMYIIVLAVLLGGILFKLSADYLKNIINSILKKVPVELFVFFLVLVTGLLSSVITAIVASLFLVEIINLLPLSRKGKINVDITACFSIGLGAVLTPIGEPLSTIVVAKLNVGFWYMLNTLGYLIIPGIIVFGFIAVFVARRNKLYDEGSNITIQGESYKEIAFRALKIFLFIIALDLLGSGFKPIIDTYVIKLNSKFLFWLNMLSAILDNATLASAEISVKMSANQIVAILMGLLVSGGMMIPGNIPNIISAGKLKIKSKDWIKLGIPMGLIAMTVYFAVIFYL